LEQAMNVAPIMLALGWIGIFAPVALGAIGSIVGCARAGQAACGALLEVEGGYGRFIGISAMPSSQTIYGIVVMLALNRTVTLENAPGLFAIGTLAGLALMLSGFYQGSACAAAIHVSKSKPEVFGLSIAPAAVIEGFAVFAFVFALILVGSLPGGG
jgi:V/A-type H+-transporting ATPase subunit K